MFFIQKGFGCRERRALGFHVIVRGRLHYGALGRPEPGQVCANVEIE